MANPTAALDADRLSLAQPFRFASRPVTVRFVVAASNVEVRHGCSELPHGYLVLSSAGAITRAPGVAWTKELVTLRSSVANDEVVLVFVVLKEDPLDVNP